LRHSVVSVKAGI